MFNNGDIRGKAFGVALAAVLSLLFCGSIIAQTDLSSLRGTVRDTTGGVLPGVQMAVEEQGTNVTVRTVITDDSGNYEIPYLKRGRYRLSAALTGFQTSSVEGIILESSQIRRVDIVLAVGETTTEITVTGGEAVIETEDPKITGVLNQDRYLNSAIVASGFQTTEMLLTLPQIQPGTGVRTDISFAGQPSSQVQQGIDGVMTDGSVNLVNHMEDMEEMKAVSVNNSAEFSRAGNFNLVSKRGANSLHGQVFYRHENSALNARQFFDPTRSFTLIHTYGAQASGPIIPNRTFFFASYNAAQDRSSFWFIGTVPTAKMRTGDFSELLSLAKPVVIKDPLTGAAFPGNLIPTARLSPLALRVQEKYLPGPNSPGIDGLGFNNNYAHLHPYAYDLYRRDAVTQRIDHQISGNNSLYGRFSINRTPYVLARTLPTLISTRLRRHHAFVVSDTHTFNPSVVNEFRFGWIGERVLDGTEVKGYTPTTGDTVLAELGLEGTNRKGLSAQGFPTMSITGYTGLSVRPGGEVQRDHTLSFADSVTWISGRHVTKLGGELRRFRNSVDSVPATNWGSFTFNGTLSKHAYADFLLGMPYQSQRADPITDRTLQAAEWGLFVTDTFKVNSNLTLDYGLRWDYFGAPSYQDGLQYNWDSVTGSVIVPQAALASVSAFYPSQITIVAGDVIRRPEKSNFAPRLGFAYRLGNLTVLRGGYGIYTEPQIVSDPLDYFGDPDGAQGGGPFGITETYRNKIVNGQPLFAFPNPFPASGATIASQSVSGYPLDVANGYVQQYNLTLERQVRSVGIRASYIGSRAAGLNYSVNINKPEPSLVPFSQSRLPYPQFVGASYLREDGETRYNALTLEARKKMGGLAFDVHWTWAHNMANHLNNQNPYDLGSWNRDSATPNQRAVFNVTWQAPVGRGRRFLSETPVWLDHVVGGWRLYWIGFLATPGRYFTPSFSGSDPSNTNTSGGLPDRIADGNLPSEERTLSRWFDTSAFVVPQPGRFGNSGVNILAGPGRNVHHFSINKQFALRERLVLQYSLGISNLFNHPNFNNPGANISNTSAGVITGTYASNLIEGAGARSMDMRLRLMW